MMMEIASQGLSGHRGATVTTAILSEEVFWTTMSTDVAKWRRLCPVSYTHLRAHETV